MKEKTTCLTTLTILKTFVFKIGNDPEEINAEIRKALASGKPIEYDLPEGAVT